jgi:hypothetical protein
MPTRSAFPAPLTGTSLPKPAGTAMANWSGIPPLTIAPALHKGLTCPRTIPASSAMRQVTGQAGSWLA